jgi:hypothetical protein
LTEAEAGHKGVWKEREVCNAEMPERNIIFDGGLHVLILRGMIQFGNHCHNGIQHLLHSHEKQLI